MALYKEKRVAQLIPNATHSPFTIPAYQTVSIPVTLDLPTDWQADEFGFAIHKLPWPAGPVYETYPISER